MSTQIIKINEEGQVWADMPANDQNPCLDCGACCSHFRVSFYQGELQSMGGWVPDEKVTPINAFYVAMKGTECGGGKCIGLDEHPDGSIGCNIYASRPSVCRAYLVWDENGQPNESCQKLRQKKGLPALAAQK